MKLRTLIVTVAVLAVVSAAVFLVRRPGPPPSTDVRIGTPLADARTLEKASKVQLSAQSKTIVLTKQPDGTWLNSSYFNLPVDFSKLSQLVGTLAEAKLQRLVTSNPERIARLEFKDSAIQFLDAADKELWSVNLGKTSENGLSYVRFGGESKAYLVSANIWVDMEPRSWTDTHLLKLNPNDVAKVEFSLPQEPEKTITATRAKKEDLFTAENGPPGQKLKSDIVSRFLGLVTALNFSDSTEPTDPQVAVAKAHARTLKLTLFDGNTVTIALGRKPEEKIVKPPAPDAAKSGPGALLEAAKATPEQSQPPGSDSSPNGPAKSLESATETIPAGPVFVFITHSDPKAPVNALMKQRAFNVSDYVFTGLPQNLYEIFDSVEPTPETRPEEKAPTPTPAPQP